jgi:hypothetical protein
MHIEELNDLYSLSSIFRVITFRRLKWAVHGECMGEKGFVYRLLVGKPEGKRPLGRHRRRWQDNIMMDFQGVGYVGMNWIKLA